MSFWNDYLAGITAGAAAGYAITPIMTILDMSIIRSQFEHIGLSKALKSTTADLLTRRAKWNPAAGIMFGVYASTYITANTTRVYCNENKIDVVVPVALATSIVNSVTIALKDRAYARLFTGTPKYFPMSSLLLFGLRDGVTISSTFVVREEVRDWLEKDMGMQKETANLGSAFGLPMLAQFVATPFHVLALDKYERPKASLTSRLALIAENFVPVTAGRMLRIVPAFGVGGYLNDKIREAAESIVGIAAEPENDMLQSHGARLLRRTTIV